MPGKGIIKTKKNSAAFFGKGGGGFLSIYQDFPQKTAKINKFVQLSKYTKINIRMIVCIVLNFHLFLD